MGQYTCNNGGFIHVFSFKSTFSNTLIVLVIVAPEPWNKIEFSIYQAAPGHGNMGQSHSRHSVINKEIKGKIRRIETELYLKCYHF